MASRILFSTTFLSLNTGQFAFTYNRGHGECRNPVSKIKSCTEDTRMMLNFQACPDVEGTESTGKGEKFNQTLWAEKVLIPSNVDSSFFRCLVGIRLKILIKFLFFSLPLHVHQQFPVEELTCLATWKDNNAHYIVGTLSHSRATSNEERFRCFVYEKINANSGKHGKCV